MASNIGNLHAKITADAGKFSREMKRAEKDAQGFVGTTKKGFTQLSGSVKALGGVFTAVLAGTVVSAVKEAIDAIAQVGTAAEALGVDPQKLQQLQGGLAKIGIRADETTDILQTLNERMAEAAEGGNETATRFEVLGLNVTDASGKMKSADQVLLEIVDSLGQFASESDRSAWLTEVLGDQAVNLASQADEGKAGIERLTEGVKAHSDATIEEAQKLKKEYQALTSSLSKWFQGMAVDVGKAFRTVWETGVYAINTLRGAAGEVKKIVDKSIQGQIEANHAWQKSIRESIAAADGDIEAIKKLNEVMKSATAQHAELTAKKKELAKADADREAKKGSIGSLGAAFKDTEDEARARDKAANKAESDARRGAKATARALERQTKEYQAFNEKIASERQALSIALIATEEERILAEAEVKKQGWQKELEDFEGTEQQKAEIRKKYAQLFADIDAEAQAQIDEIREEEVAEVQEHLEQLRMEHIDSEAEITGNLIAQLEARRDAEIEAAQEELERLKAHGEAKEELVAATEQKIADINKKYGKEIAEENTKAFEPMIGAVQALATDGVEGLNRFFDSLINHLIEVAIREAATQIFGGGAGGGNDIFGQIMGGIFGGGFGGGSSESFVADSLSGSVGFGDAIAALPGFATGGRPTPHDPVVVGEKGPEIFVPDSAGTIIPNHRLPSVAAPTAPMATAQAAPVMVQPIVNVEIESKGTPQRIASQQTNLTPKGIVTSIVVEDLARGGQISQALNNTMGTRRRV